ncbi:Succinyl-CoA:(R)-benzylsuccinate CoA-transferase subunit BbsE [subsurface metagenome]
MLAQLGVEVIKVERPGGDPGRILGPFYHDIPDPEKSLFWFAYNINKKGITLNIERADGKEIFKKLVKTADFVLESFDLGYLDSLGLGYAGLSEINKGIILASVSPFGHTGPYKDYKASGLVASAMGGMMYVTGEPDRPPVRVSFDQAYLLGSSHAAVGAMLAHYYRELTGEGQWIDTSVQGCWPTSFVNMMPMWELADTISHRAGSMRVGIGRNATLAYPCKDGFISYLVLLGLGGIRANAAMVEWMDTEGMADEYIKNLDWATLDMSSCTQEQLDAIQDRVGKFFLTHTKSELLEGFLKRRIMGLPFSTFVDLLLSVLQVIPDNLTGVPGWLILSPNSG